jgi:hypothetical protein
VTLDNVTKTSLTASNFHFTAVDASSDGKSGALFRIVLRVSSAMAAAE